MSVRLLWLIPIGLAVAPAAVALSRSSADVPTPTGQIETIPGPKSNFVGNAGCAAAGCHNANDLKGKPGSEYSTWASSDPHARAYEVLRKPESQRMWRLYRGLDEKATAAPEREAVCLKCHGPAASEISGHKGDYDLRFDAVGCESCHGSAEKWRTTHYLREWKSLDATAKHALGMTPTKNLSDRIAKCAMCHVGIKGQDVDHDLIAAGHPRLFFEYAAYHDILPKHWREPTEGQGFSAKAWALGQIAGARAAVELLADRACRPNRWPELAELNCYACHHQLAEKNWRLERTQNIAPPGTAAYGTWYLPLVEVLAKHANQLGPEYEPVEAPATKSLCELMQRTNPDAKAVAEESQRLSARLKNWEDKLNKTDLAPPTAGGVRKLFETLANAEPSATADWELATQRYLALAALYRAYPDSWGDAGPKMKAALQKLRDVLVFRDKAGGVRRLNSPAHFRPGAVQEAMAGLRQ